MHLKTYTAQVSGTGAPWLGRIQNDSSCNCGIFPETSASPQLRQINIPQPNRVTVGTAHMGKQDMKWWWCMVMYSECSRLRCTPGAWGIVNSNWHTILRSPLLLPSLSLSFYCWISLSRTALEINLEHEGRDGGGGRELLEAHIDKSLQVRCRAKTQQQQRASKAPANLLRDLAFNCCCCCLCGGNVWEFYPQGMFSTSTRDWQLTINLFKNWDTSVWNKGPTEMHVCYLKHAFIMKLSIVNTLK